MFALLLLLAPLLVEPVVEERTTWLKSEVIPAKSASLQIASRRYEHPEAPGQDIWLVGVSHIGNASFYNDIEALVSGSDLVLYESVMEEVTRGPSGETPEQKREATEAAMNWLAEVVASSEVRAGTPAVSLDEVEVRVQDMDRRLVDAVRAVRQDAWGHPLGLAWNANKTVLVSMGRDGLLGGLDEDADLEVVVVIPEDVGQVEGIQEALARALKLDFQIAVLPYERPDWRMSDMTWETLEGRFQEEGIDLEGLSGMLEGSSLPAGIAKLFLRILPSLDLLTGGAITDGVKVMLVELLGREDAMEIALREVGGAGGRILLEERNEVVIADLQGYLDSGEYNQIAILYGAGHMPHMGERVEAMGWTEAEVRWLPGITVDLEKSRLSPMHMTMIRTSINRALERLKHQQ